MVTLDLSVVGSQQLRRTLRRYIDAVADLHEPFNDVADAFAKIELRQFLTQGKLSGEEWAPLAPGYARWKAKRYPGRPILVRTGELRRQLTTRPFGVEQIAADHMVLGTTLDYARYHQRGTPRMPARKPVNLTESQRQDLAKIVQRYLRGAVADKPESL